MPMTGCTVLAANELYDLKGSLAGPTTQLLESGILLPSVFEMSGVQMSKYFTLAGRMDAWYPPLHLQVHTLLTKP